MNKALLLFLFILLGQALGGCSAPLPREGFIRTSDNVRLFYKIVGSGSDVLVVAHGGPANSMESILPDLEPLVKNRTIVYYDQRGGGRSDLILDRENLSISKHIDNLEAVRRYFYLEKMTVLGNSWGGILVGFYAAAHPDRIERMILHSPGEPSKTLSVKADEELRFQVNRKLSAEQKKRLEFLSNPQNWIESADAKAVCREFYQLLLPFYVSKPENVALLKGDVCAGSDETVRHQQAVSEQIISSLGDWNLLPSLSTFQAPVLVIHGTVDPTLFTTSATWASAMPNARLLDIDGAGHFPHVEQPEVFFKAVETFLKGDFPPEARSGQRFVERD